MVIRSYVKDINMTIEQEQRTKWIMAIAKGEVIIPDAATSNDSDKEESLDSDNDDAEGNE